MSDENKSLNKKDQKRLKEKRGEGAGKDYIPFIKVGEFSSSGESVRVKSSTVGRIHHFHSGIELAAFLVFDWCADVVDIREQFPIPIIDSLNICRQLGIKHPQVKGKLIIVTTDLLINMADGSQVAIAVKPANRLDNKRVLEKLQIEKSYWESSGSACFLFTEKEVSNNLKMNLKWLQPVLDIDQEVTYQLAKQDVVSLFGRINKDPAAFVARYCAQLDDRYQVEPGYHIEVLRFGIANHYLKTSLETSFPNWKCNDIEFVSVDKLELGVVNAS
ncbi:TnsA endonuclease N-terminal domain-containing protein [Vibrio sp. 1-Bac 57]